MASIDKDHRFIGILGRRNGGKYTFFDKDLGDYFVPKEPKKITEKNLEKIQRRKLDKQSLRLRMFLKESPN